MSVTAIVPLKALDHAKQRLAGHLTAGERQVLVRGVFAHVLDVCLRTPEVAHLIAVVGDDAGAALADEHGVTALREPGGGLNRAVSHATATLAPGTTSLVVVADLPEVSPADLSALVNAGVARGGRAARGRGARGDDRSADGAGDDGDDQTADPVPAVLVAPTHDGGTGALLCHPAGVIAPAFGVASAAAHLDAATRAGVRAGVLWRPGLAHDVDRPEDLARYAGQAAGSRTL